MSLLKTPREKEKLLITSNFSFSGSVFYPLLANFLPFSLDLKLSSANSFSLEELKICRLVKSQNILRAHKNILFVWGFKGDPSDLGTKS